MKRALISDIHANFEALRVVLDDIRQQGITTIYCLGDIIGYGPNPCECIDIVMDCTACILGNHDQAALFRTIDRIRSRSSSLAALNCSAANFSPLWK